MVFKFIISFLGDGLKSKTGMFFVNFITIVFIVNLTDMPDHFLHPYSADDLELFDYQIRKAYQEYPYSIISVLQSYQEYLAEENYLRAFRRYLDFFEISVQYCSSLLLGLLKHEKVAFDETLQQVSAKIVEKELSTGDWVNSIFLVLLKKAVEKLPDDRLVNNLFDTLSDNRGNILLGWSSKKEEEFKSLPYFRNTYYGHDSSLSEKIYKDVLSRIEPRIFVMLKAMAPLGKYTTFTVDKVVDEESERKKYTIRLLKGVNPGETIRISSEKRLPEGKYYMVRRPLDFGDVLASGDIVEITPFVIYLPYLDQDEDSKTTYLFQSVKAGNLRKMIYISPNIDAVRKETELFKDLFMEFLETTLGRSIIDKNYNIAISKGKTWEEFQEIMLGQTGKFVGQMKSVKKYDPELYVDRLMIRSAWDKFMGMDDRRAFVLLGNAGSGKTNLICRLAEDLAGVNTPVITYNSKIFSLVSLEDRLKEDFREMKLQAPQILEQLNKKAVEQGRSVVFLFDALNECLEYDGSQGGNGPVRLLQAIDRLLVRQEYTAFKVLITCRTYTWEEAVQSEKGMLNLACYLTSEDIEQGDGSANISLKGFSEDEFRFAYPRYQEKFSLQTTLESLFEPGYAFTRARLEDPLILSLSAQIYAGGHLPQQIRQFDSVKLFSARMEMLEKSQGGVQQIMILEEFTRELRRRRVDGLRLKWLYLACDNDADPLHALSMTLFQGSTYEWKPAMKAILDAGILRVEKSLREHELRFTFERFHEYFHARVFVEEESAKLAQGLPIQPSAYERELESMKGYAVINGAMRHALLLDYDYTKGDPSTLIGLANSPVYGAAPLVMTALTSLIVDNYGEVCRIIHQLLEHRKADTGPMAEELEDKERLIEEGNKGKKKMAPEEIDALNREVEALSEKLQPVIQVRKVAVQVIYEIFKSQVYARNLYEGMHSPFELLWTAMGDPVARVRDNVSLYIYYISKYDVTIGIRILDHLSEGILDTSMFSLVSGPKRKEFQQSFLEPAGRLSLLLVVEGLVERGDYELSDRIKETWKAILKKLTLNFTLVRVVMPFLKFFLRRQATVQVAYVNNGIEYQHFWETVARTGDGADWNMESFGALVPLLDPAQTGFENHHEAVSRAIRTGDAFSYFLIERVMVAQGWSDWQRIRRLALEVAERPADEPLVDYMQMSMLYVLFHSLEKSDHVNEEAFDIFSRLTESWSERCRGLFFAHRNQQANKGLPYKQYPLNWYGAAYCRHWGDGGARPGDPHPLPVFRNLIDKAVDNNDKELLYYCLENIATLVTDFSKPVSAIGLFGYVLGKFRHESQIAALDAIPASREEHQKDLRTFLCGIMGTIKSYYPREAAQFIQHRLTASDFPGIEHFREELAAYNQSHESIADLLTHKFGNFIIWGLLHDKAVSRFFQDGFAEGARSEDYFDWFDGIVRLSFNRLFGIKV